MIVIGIIGGIASGKSRVAEQLASLGAEVIRADELGHEVLLESAVKAALTERWGAKILGEDGQIDRQAVAELVFEPTASGLQERRFLESVTHPRIGERVQARLQQFRERGVDVVVLDAAVLLEAGWRQNCDKLLFVDASREQRLQRARGRGWTEAEFQARESVQVSVEEKRKLADWVIDNSGDFDHTFAQVRQFWQSLGLFPA